jgi:hypothetical protein
MGDPAVAHRETGATVAELARAAVERERGPFIGEGSWVDPEQLKRDGRLSSSPRPWLKGWELFAWSLFRSAVLACQEGPRGLKRAAIAEKLGISESTLEDWICPSGNSVPRFTSAMVMIGGLLGDEERQRLGRDIAAALGLEVVAKANARLDTAPLHVQCLQIGAALGRVHHSVQMAMSESGEGGTAVMPAELREMIRDVGQVNLESGELLVSLRAELSRMTGGEQ